MNVSIIREELIRAETLRRRRSSSRATAAVVVSAMALIGASVLYANAHGIILNVTPSLPIGFYRLSPLPAVSDLHGGDMVYACPPDPSASPAMRQAIRRHWLMTKPGSPCADRLVPFLKRIAALPGQHVTISMSGMSVDGHSLPSTAIKARSKTGLPITHYPLGSYTARPGHVWLTDNSSPWAYDSRYWGPVTTSHLLASARPVLTW